jgi:transposase InsO family protein
LTIKVNHKPGLSLDEIRAFLKASEGVHFEGEKKEEVYAWVSGCLGEQKWDELGRTARGLVRRYMEKMTGLSRAQITRLITRYGEDGEVRLKRSRRHRFAPLYGHADVALLASVDAAHETLSGPATQKILQRQCYDFGDPHYDRLARISVAQIYRLRKSAGYRKQRVAYQCTRAVQVAIGQRRAPQPEGRPGYLRVDTVHQGDRDGVKGVYHINAVDEVTQWEVVSATAQISEAALKPVLEAMLRQFPFRVLGFHSDNGSEFINHVVAELLNKLLIEQTKSRPRRCNDNALVECKNGAVIRKHIGYGYIAAEHAAAMQSFYVQYFNPYLNFHRPCGVPERVVNAKGKERKRYRWYATPWEILRQLPGLAGYLKGDLTPQELDGQSRRQTNMQAAAAMQAAKQKLFASFPERRTA